MEQSSENYYGPATSTTTENSIYILTNSTKKVISVAVYTYHLTPVKEN